MTLEQQPLEDLEPEVTEPEEPEVEPEAEPESEPAAQFVEYEGERIPVEDFRAYVQFSQWVAQNPEAWQELQEWEQGKRPLVEPQQQFPDEEEFEFESDPRYDRLQSEIQELKQNLNQVGQVATWREEQARREALQAGIATFSERHPDLPQEDWDKLFVSARDHMLIANYIARDPYNPVEAVNRALEAAYKIEFYDRATNAGATQAVDDINRKRRAAAAATSRAAAPKPTPEETGTREAMVKDIAAILNASS